jgi:hypothetical protein
MLVLRRLLVRALLYPQDPNPSVLDFDGALRQGRTRDDQDR